MNLPEIPNWEEVYRIETSDLVLGGDGGTTNVPLKQLTNRTRWLKEQVEEISQSVQSLSNDKRAVVFARIALDTTEYISLQSDTSTQIFVVDQKVGYAYNASSSSWEVSVDLVPGVFIYGLNLQGLYLIAPNGSIITLIYTGVA